MTPLALWVSVSLVLSSLLYATVVGGVSLGVVALFAGGIFVFATILLIAALTGAYSPILLTGVLLRRPTTTKKSAHALAGRDVLSALGLAETVVDADVDARLVTTRDGVVVYGNGQYMRVARQAGVVGMTGLPPRIDRLFSQASGESSKMFRLARAARSGEQADEIITQTMGTGEGGAPRRRRFEVSVRPMADKGRHVAWRLREMAVETARDTFRKAYETYPRPVLALERSGNIAWLNEAAKQLLGVATIRDVSFSDILLGESKDVVEGLWEDTPEEIEGRVRSKGASGGNESVVFTAFTRAGVGEGFVCVEMMPKSSLTTDRGGEDSAFDVTDAPFGVAVVEGDMGTDARLASVNRLFADSLGAEQDMRIADILPPDAMRDLIAAMRAKSSTKALTRPVDIMIGEGADGQHLRIMARPIRRRRGAYGPRQMVLYALDVSFQKRMEEDYAHDKRLKAIGKIAGSVAHDFNNFLQAMMGATEFLMRRHPAGDPSYPDLVSIKENAQRARNLTSNLLAFSRKQTLQPEVVSVTELLSDFTPFVQRYVTEKVKVEVAHGRQVGCVKADRSQLELAIMNLAVNARDAMDKGGTLTISSRRVPANEIPEFGYQVLEAIDHVLIEMADTGSGVPGDIADKIFEPFFTTKGEGK
ncbi:MAG: ATP-binding protein, partial [Pseudomonadota bacterium]